MRLMIVQVYTFFIMLGFGFLLGLIYGLYQRIHRGLKLRQLWIDITDVLLGLVAGIGGFLLLFHVNRGEFRFYVVFAMIIGFAIYHYLFKRHEVI